MNTIFETLCLGDHLSEDKAYLLMIRICNNECKNSEIAAILAFYMTRDLSLEELQGFKKALLDMCLPVHLEKQAIDVCGTGGDQKNTFNISTLSAFVLAASGIPVAKHGNYGSSSISGSSDILLYLGYTFPETSEELNRALDRYNICFIHAPLFHPSLKYVAQVRKEIGRRTFFNMLGPLVNPANIQHRYIGVYNLEVARLYNYILQKEKTSYGIVHTLDGYDEISLTEDFKYISRSEEVVMSPRHLGLDTITSSSIHGGESIKEAADIFVSVLEGSSSTEQKNVVLANSAMAMHGYKPELSLEECMGRCIETLESQKAYELFKSIMHKN